MEKTEEFMKPEITFGDTLRFTPYAYAKLLWMRDRGPTEVAGYCVTATKDPLLVTNFVLIKQKCTSMTFDLDAEDGAEYAERMMDEGIPPWACLNILAHSHPGSSPSPSLNDEENFEKAFSHPNWAVMLIVARSGDIYCRLKINIGPGVEKELKVAIDWSVQFNGSDILAWNDEYVDKVTEHKFRMTGKEGVAANNVTPFREAKDFPWRDHEKEEWVEFCSQSEGGDEEIDDINSDCFWNEDGCASYWCCEDDMWYYFYPIGAKWFRENDSNDSIEEIERPNKAWTPAIVEWATRFADERVV